MLATQRKRAGNRFIEADAKAILPERRSVKKQFPISKIGSRWQGSGSRKLRLAPNFINESRCGSVLAQRRKRTSLVLCLSGGRAQALVAVRKDCLSLPMCAIRGQRTAQQSS